MNATVQKWGNSLALRIPSAMAKDMGLRPGAPVELNLDAGSLIVKPARKRKASLAQLLLGVSKANIHDEADWGASMGGETL